LGGTSEAVALKYSGLPMTFGNAVAAHVRLIAWCLDCHHQIEPDSERYGAGMTVPVGAPGLCAPNAAAGASIWW